MSALPTTRWKRSIISGCSPIISPLFLPPRSTSDRLRSVRYSTNSVLSVSARCSPVSFPALLRSGEGWRSLLWWRSPRRHVVVSWYSLWTSRVSLSFAIVVGPALVSHATASFSRILYARRRWTLGGLIVWPALSIRIAAVTLIISSSVIPPSAAAMAISSVTTECLDQIVAGLRSALR